MGGATAPEKRAVSGSATKRLPTFRRKMRSLSWLDAPDLARVSAILRGSTPSWPSRLNVPVAARHSSSGMRTPGRISSARAAAISSAFPARASPETLTRSVPRTWQPWSKRRTFLSSNRPVLVVVTETGMKTTGMRTTAPARAGAGRGWNPNTNPAPDATQRVRSASPGRRGAVSTAPLCSLTSAVPSVATHTTGRRVGRTCSRPSSSSPSHSLLIIGIIAGLCWYIFIGRYA